MSCVYCGILYFIDLHLSSNNGLTEYNQKVIINLLVIIQIKNISVHLTLHHPSFVIDFFVIFI